ncbi:MAG: helix-turn-helix domain-containing protein [Candidatus Sumerlaeota bacterium]
MTQSMTIDDVAKKTGMEASQVRFLTSIFSGFFPDARYPDPAFDDEEIERLCFVRDLTERRGFTIEEVHRELQADPNPHKMQQNRGVL